MSGFFSKVKSGLSGLSDLFGLGKSNGSNQGLFKKAKEYLTGGLQFLNSKTAKKGVDLLSNLTGTSGVRDFFNDAKKGFNIGNNLLNGGLDKTVNRSGLPQLADRFENRFKKAASMELQPKRQQNDQFNLNSIFG